jgi:cytoskeletal protein RodZ
VWNFTDNGNSPSHTELGKSYNSALSGSTTSVAEIKLRNVTVKSKTDNITNLKIDGTKYKFNFYHKQNANMTTTIKM